MNKRIVAYHISRLRDHDPAVRLKTIDELRQLGETEALDALRAVYETDSDPAVRRAAQQAGREIFLRARPE